MAGTQRISLDPDPPQAGKDLEICYDFGGAGIDKTNLKVSFEPPGAESDIYHVSKDIPCVTIVVPQGAEAILVEDLDGPSPDKGAVIV